MFIEKAAGPCSRFFFLGENAPCSTPAVGADPPVAQKAPMQLEAAAVCGLRQFRAQQLSGTHPGECSGLSCCPIAVSVTTLIAEKN